MVNTISKEHGFSLIELMVTVALLTVLALMGTSLTGLWSKQAELDKGVMSLQSGMSLAISTALRNEYPLGADYTASQLCFDQVQHALTVHKSTNTQPASCLTPIVFDYSLSDNIEIKEGNRDFVCYAFDNFGQRAKNPKLCQTGLSLTISNGVLDEDVDFD